MYPRSNGAKKGRQPGCGHISFQTSSKKCNNTDCACINVNTRITRLNAQCGIAGENFAAEIRWPWVLNVKYTWPEDPKVAEEKKLMS